MIAKKIFGHDHEILYDSVTNHDTYAFLRVTLEVPRGQDIEALILLNGKEIGKVQVIRDKKKTLGYIVYSKKDADYIPFMSDYKFIQLGSAVASLLTNRLVV